MAKPRKQGGLALKYPYWQGIALLARWASKLLSDTKSKWAQIFISNLSATTWIHQQAFTRHNYSIYDKILFRNPRKFGNMVYTKGLWFAWTHLRKQLQFNIREAFLLAHWMINDTLSVIQINEELSHDCRCILASIFGQLGVNKAADLWNRHKSRWRDFSHKISRLRNIPSWLKLVLKQHLKGL